MFEFELAQENRNSFKNEIKSSLVKKVKPYCEFTDIDRYFFSEGTHKQLYKKFGAHVVRDESGILGTYFCVYAPHAKHVAVVGDFNHWNGELHGMIGENGIWSLYIPKLQEGHLYKYEITTSWGEKILKADPYAFYAENRPNTASMIYDIEGFEWTDEKWVNKRRQSNIFEQPLNIYELHLGSWRRGEELVETESFHTYAEIADDLIQYVLDHSYTHIELMPLYEHPFDGSWGYQATGYYAASSRYGEPKELMMFINRCHEAGIGVIMDWVPGHFCRDAHGLYKFDGEAVYEYPFDDAAVSEWGTANFDLAKGEVRSFLISNALFWMKYYHVDGFRVDAVANIIYWGGNKERGENHGAIEFLKRMNTEIFAEDDKVLMIAEDSTSYPLVTAPVSVGGLGFSYKWNMGWMNDTLDYIELDNIYRPYHHNYITFAMAYAYSENFVLPFSHDEVVHGKKSLVDKAPGDYWKKMAQYRLLCTYQMTLPGKKLNFMANEIAQFHEWKDKEQVDWHLLTYPAHDASNRYIKDLNKVYLNDAAFWELDHSFEGFEWIDVNNNEQSMFSYIRRAKDSEDFVVVVLNFKPVSYHNYRLGVPKEGEYVEVLNSDRNYYHGSNQYNGLPLVASEGICHGKPYFIEMTIPPYGAVILKYRAKKNEEVVLEEEELIETIETEMEA